MSLVLPESLQHVEAVRSIRAPARLDYAFTAGDATTKFLTGLEQKVILGAKCAKCGEVYVPSRGSCPMDGIPTGEMFPVAQTGVVTTFCVVNVQFHGQAMEVPYVCATVVLDGADIGLFGLVQEIPANEVRMGMRVEAVWADKPTKSQESIVYYRPIDEPDAAFDTYRRHL